MERTSARVTSWKPTGAPTGPVGPRRTLCAVCLAVPIAVLVVSYVWLAVDRDTAFLWNVVVHESGRYTFGGTVLYFDHFLREIPTVLAYALFLMAVGGNADVGSRISQERALTVGWAALLMAAALVGCAFVVAARSAGWGSALQDLLQFRTRDDLAEYGSHWRFHWLSTLWFGAGALIAPGLARMLPGRPELRLSPRWVAAAWGFFVLSTLVFGLSGEVFTDGRYVGHQAREILTHGTVTALLGMGVLFAVTPAGRSEADGRHPGALAARSAVCVAGALFFLIPAYLAVVSLVGDAMSEGQTGGGLASMVGAHYFEHTLDYLLVFLLLAAGLGLTRPGSPVRSHAPIRTDGVPRTTG